MMTSSVVFVLLAVLGQTSAKFDTNIARGGNVIQSSLFGNGVPERAIDGNRTSDLGQGSCSITQADLKPWWRLDLMKTYQINNVTITNRGDCCPERINGAEIRIGNSLYDNGNDNPRCAVISSMAAGTSQTFMCNRMEGHYVNIVIPGRQEYLTLCEVEVTGQALGITAPTDTNIARCGNVIQSSLYGNDVPERAIDGNRASNYGQGSCSVTNNDLKPWWRLDLLKTYQINTVTITNRGDCCPERINGAEIRIGNSLNDNGNDNPRCAVISSIKAGTSQTFACNRMEGRYVNIVIPGRREYLTLCEVEVTGQALDTNIARRGNVIQSSLYGNDVPERAIDGNRASNYGQGSCSVTNNDLKPWWRLDLLKTYQINTVTITNRGDCCPERINGAEIRIGNSLNDNGNDNPRCAVISSIKAGTSQTFACNRMEGRYVNIVIPGRREYLTLCEVEVTGQALDTNIARRGNVIQSSLYGNDVPERAIDGNRASNYGQGSCSVTNNDLKPWWRLDLLKTYQINTVTITNRGDCCPERINGAEIRIGNSLNDNGNDNPRCAVISSIKAGTSQTFACNRMEGRYVNIVIPGRREYLTLCEVEVTGQALDTNIARRGNVIQSSLYGNDVPERAIDGNRASNYGQRSCSVTNNDLKPWWRLDLLKTYQINTVTITNRGDCCPERINGAEIRIGNSLNDNGNDNPRCAVISSIKAGTSQTFACNRMEGRYVNIVIPGRREYLTLCEVEVTGQALDTNIARRGNVIQSSLYGNDVPERAIDGNRASNYGQGSCSVTNNDLKPWWRLDLLKTYQINTVTITNRGDCCPERINGAEIRIGNSLNDNGNDNPRCAVISSIKAGTSQTFACNRMEGRYVNIVIPGRREYLTLCEVEVTGQALDTNIARRGNVIQSSLYGNDVPERAIDGNRASNYGQRSCSVTNNDLKPWWRLDLLKTYQINTVTITNRGDCCPERINGAEIRIGNSLNDNGNDNPRCAVISSIKAGTSQTFACNRMEGRYVNIVIPGRREYLTLCEVEVTGQALDTNIARRGNVIQSSLYGNDVPERAIDGNRASNYGQGSCSVTNNDLKPWWRLDLLKTYQINTVTITNRGDCCPERINGAEIRIGNSLNDNGNDNPRCAVISSIKAGTSQTFACNRMEGRYVNIVIPGRREYLTLCEVEVTGQALDTNIARRGNVIQSSLYGNDVPERAIDGNRASNYGQGSCSVTNNDLKPWWRLDLLKTYQINTVTITNRGDCCPERINGAEIRIGNSLNDNGNDNPRCAVISSIKAGTSQTFACNRMEGRYVNIVIPGRREYLTLCEVEVTGQALDTNIARRGNVIQSSLYGNDVPERAIDGNRASNYGQRSCSVTNNDLKPWWRLDLLKTYQINTVTITNRGDCCPERINGAEIRIGNSLNDNGNDNPRCAVISSIKAGTSQTFACNRMEGRYVNIVIPGRREYLTLCEVEVTGQALDTNIARRGNVIQSSLYGNDVPERAIDGNCASNYGQGSCSVTNNDLKPWWRLDLLKTYQINTVTITNRGDCCPERINGAEIRIGNSLNDNGNDNPRCAVISSIKAGTSQTFACNRMEGRYVNIVIPGRREYLTLCEVEVTGQALDTNIARRGNVIQSSLYGNDVPERAIDGNRASNYGQGSCSVTNNDLKPWWRLDLLKTYQINTVTITNRGDCCPERINGAEIRIGNSLNDNGNDNPRCAVISSIKAGTSQTFACNRMEGRYVNIVIPGRREYLTLCEVEVTGQALDTNIARRGNVIQSSLYGNDVPERAIDGNRASNYGQGSCSVTNNDLKPWWRLDLLKTYQINTVTITNRGDCCPERINGAEIRIGNSLNDNGNDNPRCAVISSIKAGTSQTFACNRMEGRYVNIVIPGRREYLTLCEVEVTGQALDTNIARRGNVIQSSLYGNDVPERAIDGNRASNYGQGSCSVTNNDLKPWWRLDLLKTYQINTVTITNRGDCCPERINGAEIRIGNSLNDNGNDNPRCAVISSIKAGTSQTFACNRMEGRYVNIVIPGRREYLTLCEVEVTGQALDTNIARRGNVIQSSLYGNDVPERAIDGNRASNYGQGSCSVTNNDLKPWWRLDLLKTYQINTVTITNRGDCCPERINGAEIRIGNSLNDNGNDNPRCAVISSIKAGTSQTFACNRMEGRYVNIVIPGRREYLTLCEVEVTGQALDTNIARRGNVIQSSLYGNDVPERAIDGNRASNYGQGSCSVTNNDLKPWWRLDLLKTYQINTVTITNRGDCCPERINGAEIRIGNSLNDNGNDNPRCAVISSIKAGTSQTFACNRMEGRYVNIVIPGRREYLTLCEVEVTGQALDTNIARRGNVIQSSLYGNDVPERAIDGNRASNYGQGSCSVTNNDLKPWWRLDLLKTYQINTVTITNRGDCCPERINGAEIRIGNSLNDNGNDNPRCAVISSIKAGTSQTFACNRMEGRYVNIVIPGRREYLTLCEVEVTGQALDTNIARRGNVIQSSLYGNDVPARAIDGNRASNYGQGSCSVTNNDLKPWWRLDLLKTYQINTVTITNRGDCCPERINGAEIRIGNSLNDNGNDNPRCAVISSMAAGTSQTFVCNGMEGRYVNIVIPGRREYLTLCEVEVTGTVTEETDCKIIN
ncbi:uncharacterized protein LOC116058018 isoform X3 [Sander lucioperca]|uniref:uncharacterized protein LOC116058018 isoform X3 n=1 Tax=Sander lucioperca TaxID=283035 RepID=UPI00165355C9|nr:uncharacterized protein LOC116058018 isoform X3 [Sander lucioperca]